MRHRSKKNLSQKMCEFTYRCPHFRQGLRQLNTSIKEVFRILNPRC